MREQVFIACLDSGELATAKGYLEAIIKKFTVKSGRVLRLMGMKYEAEGKWTDAVGVYNLILSENPANIQAMKRMVGSYLILCRCLLLLLHILLYLYLT